MSRRARNEIDQAEGRLQRGLIVALLLALGFSLLVAIAFQVMGAGS